MKPQDFLDLLKMFGPPIIALLPSIEALFSKDAITAAEVQAIFAGLKPYSAYGIDVSKATA